jgi:pimeloyl-ACP methyl ester carboxylesterase
MHYRFESFSLPRAFPALQRLAAILVCLVALSACSGKFEPHNSREELLRVSSWGGPPVDVVAYRPVGWSAAAPVVIALHGVNRNLSYTLDTWEPLADRFGFLLIVPHFDEGRFPGSEDYAQGSVRAGRVPRWSAFNAIQPIYQEVSRRYGVTHQGYRLFGHSAGAQFLHRFLYLHPEAPVERAVISMGGWYTLPDERQDWPYGLGGTGIDPARLRPLFAREVVVQIGSRDVFRDSQLRRSHEADRQGRNRFARGSYFFERMAAAAEASGSRFGWQLVVVEDAGHDSEAGAENAARWLGAT